MVLRDISIFLAAIAIVLPLSEVEGAKTVAFNARAAELAKLLKPPRLGSKVEEGDLEKASERLIAIIELFEASYRSNGPPPVDLIETAYDEFLTLSARREMESRLVVLEAWQEAQGLGLFDDDWKFSREIKNGPDAGKDCVFEYLVPVEIVPRLSTDPMMLRIVPPSEQRKEGPLTMKEEYLLERLMTLSEQEVVDAKTVATRAKEEKTLIAERRKKEAEAAKEIWERAVAESGESFKEEPNIILNGDKTGSPSHMNGERWRVTIEAINNTRHATEVDIEVYLIGISREERNSFLLAKREEQLQLRRGEVLKAEYFSNAEKTYRETVAKIDGLNLKNRKQAKLVQADYRGWVARVLHDGKLIAKAASNSSIIYYADDRFEELKALP